MELLNPTEFVNKVKEYKQIIAERLENTRKELNKDEGEHILLDLIPLKDIQETLFVITTSLHKKYIYERKLPHLTAFETSKFLLDAKFLALSGIISILRYDYEYNKDFWQIYQEKTELITDITLYDNILIPALAGEGHFYEQGKSSLIDLLSLEGGLPYKYLTDCLNLSFFYWKYFYGQLDIKDMINLFKTGKQDFLISQILSKEEQRAFKQAYLNLHEFPSKLKIVIKNVIKMFTAWDNSNESNVQKFINTISNNENIYLFKECSEFFPALSNILNNISLKKWQKISHNTEIEEKNEYAYYGEYSLDKDRSFTVSVHPTISLKELQALPYDKVINIANTAIFKSKIPFIVYSAHGVHNVYPLKFKEEIYGYIWAQSIGVYQTVFLKKNGILIDTISNTNNIEWDIKLYQYYDDYEKIRELRYKIPYIYLNSDKDSSNEIEISNTDSLGDLHFFPLNQYGTGCDCEIDYEIKNKKPGLIYLKLLNPQKKQMLSLKSSIDEIEIPKLLHPVYKPDPYNKDTQKNILLKEIMLFGNNNPYEINPSKEPYKYGEPKLFLFTTYSINPEWFNEAVNMEKIKELKKWGDYFVYEINWEDTSQALIIDIDDEFQWIFEKTLSIGVQKQKTGTKKKKIERFCEERLVLQPEENQYFSFSDIKLKMQISGIIDILPELIICFYANGELLGQEKLGWINNQLNRAFDNLIIDEEFFRYLSGINKDIPGKYEIVITNDLQLPCYKLAESILNSFTFYILPQLHFEEVSKTWCENKSVQIIYRVKNSDEQKRLIFSEPAKVEANVKMAHKKIKGAKNLDNTKELTALIKDINYEISNLYEEIYMPSALTKLNVKYSPDVIGLKFFSIQNQVQPYIADRINYYDLDTLLLIVFSKNNDFVVSPFQNMTLPWIHKTGLHLLPLALFKGELKEIENNISVKIGNYSLNFVIEWNARVVKFNKIYPYFSAEDGLSFVLSYCGPLNSILRLKLEEIQGNPLNYEEIWCEKIKNPAFIKYNTKKKWIELICDGLNWEDRIFNIKFTPAMLLRKDVIILKGSYDYTDEPFAADLVFNNAFLNQELVKLTKLINKNPQSANNYYKRGVLFKEKELWQLALADFEKAEILGLTTKKSIQEVNEFKEKMLVYILNEDIKLLANSAKQILSEQFSLDV